MTKRYLMFAAVLAAAALAVAMQEPRKNSWNEGDHSALIKFSHTFHVKDQGVACEDCHHAAKESKVSSDKLIGDHESCNPCHEDQVKNTCTFCHASADNIVAIQTPPRELTFSHELHASKQNIKCTTCHAGLEEVTYATNANMPPMSTCTDCHETKNVSTNCETCHTDFAGLLPEDHLKGDFRRDHRRLTRLGAREVSCSTCHAESFCQDCHTNTELHGFGSMRDLMTDPSPKSSPRSSPKELRLQQVHDLNYRYSHGVDARSRASDCSSCHDRQTFCVTCHEAGGEITQQKIKPADHNEAGFTTIGKGSGGGRHAELAKRDLESCLSCHDVQGNDPTCMLCHTENGGVR